MTRQERQLWIANRFKDDLIQTQKEDIIRGELLKEPGGFKIPDWVWLMIGVSVIILCAHGLGWIKPVDKWL